jgi:hypothetical protein
LIGVGGQWFPQPHPLRVTSDNTWTTKIHFGAYGPHTVCIVKTSDLGTNLVRYFRKIASMNAQRERFAQDYFQTFKTEGTEILQMLKFKNPGIEMGALPKGIEIQDMVEIEVEYPPATSFQIKQIS